MAQFPLLKTSAVTQYPSSRATEFATGVLRFVDGSEQRYRQMRQPVRKWLLRLSSFLNFDIFIHGPHHRHPRLTHTTLEAKLAEYQQANPDVNYPAYDRYWKAMLAMAPAV